MRQTRRLRSGLERMQRVVGLLLLSAEGALAQSREASVWDANVPSYGNGTNTIAGCPCTTDCRPLNVVTVLSQQLSNTATFTFTSAPALKLAYLTDQDGTIIAYKSSDDIGVFTGDLIFEWDASKHPTGLMPHIVYASSCADVHHTTVLQTWVRQQPHPYPTSASASDLRVPHTAASPHAARAVAGHQGGDSDSAIRRTQAYV